MIWLIVYLWPKPCLTQCQIFTAHKGSETPYSHFLGTEELQEMQKS